MLVIPVIPFADDSVTWKRTRLAMLGKQQPNRGKLKRQLRSVDEKLSFYQLTQRGPDLALSAYISKVRRLVSKPTRLVECFTMDAQTRLYALHCWQASKYVRSRPFECEKLETAVVSLVPRPGGHGRAFKAIVQGDMQVYPFILTLCSALVQLRRYEAQHYFVNQFKK